MNSDPITDLNKVYLDVRTSNICTKSLEDLTDNDIKAFSELLNKTVSESPIRDVVRSLFQRSRDNFIDYAVNPRNHALGMLFLTDAPTIAKHLQLLGKVFIKFDMSTYSYNVSRYQPNHNENSQNNSFRGRGRGRAGSVYRGRGRGRGGNTFRHFHKNNKTNDVDQSNVGSLTYEDSKTASQSNNSPNNHLNEEEYEYQEDEDDSSQSASWSEVVSKKTKKQSAVPGEEITEAADE